MPEGCTGKLRGKPHLQWGEQTEGGSRPAATTMGGKGWASDCYFLAHHPRFCLQKLLCTELAGCKLEREMLHSPACKYTASPFPFKG